MDAYSADNYTLAAWRECCRMLARRGFDAVAIEVIMRSKWTRWAADGSLAPYGRHTSRDLARFLDSGTGITPKNWADNMYL